MSESKIDIVRRLVIFCIIMESNNGIIDKDPKYVYEKYVQAITVPFPENMLDFTNFKKYKEWLEKWAEKKGDEE